MIAIIARVEINPKDADRYVELAQALVEPTREEKGCEVYGMSRDICEPNVVWISEQWETQEDLDNHLQMPHIKDFLEKTHDLDVIAMDDRQYMYTSWAPVVLPE